MGSERGKNAGWPSWRSSPLGTGWLGRAPSAILSLVTQRDHVEVIREAFERWNRRDIDYWVRLAHPEVEIWSKYAALDGEHEPYRGHDGIRAWRAEIDRNFELHHVVADEIRTVAGRVLVLGSVRVRGRTSGTEMVHPFGWVCEMRDGALSRMLFFSNHTDALREVESLAADGASALGTDS